MTKDQLMNLTKEELCDFIIEQSKLFDKILLDNEDAVRICHRQAAALEKRYDELENIKNIHQNLN